MLGTGIPVGLLDLRQHRATSEITISCGNIDFTAGELILGKDTVRKHLDGAYFRWRANRVRKGNALLF
jgi:hypothetical protein